MNDAFGVCRVECVGDCDTQTQQPFQLQRFALNQVLQGLARETFHCDERASFVLPNFMDGADVGMVQRRSGASLSPEAFQGLGIL